AARASARRFRTPCWRPPLPDGSPIRCGELPFAKSSCQPASRVLMRSPVQRRPREEARKARTSVYRQHIFEAAARVFAERGFEAAKVQEISELAGLSMGTIYGIFPGKTELFAAVREARGQEILELVRQVTARKTPPRETLLALIEVYIDYFLAHP